MWMPKGANTPERCIRGPTHFALSALNQTTIAAPGPLGRAITFRAFGAQDNDLQIK
jgi:hypothetical protein